MSAGHVKQQLRRGLWVTSVFLLISMPMMACEGECRDRSLVIDEALEIATSRDADSLTKLRKLRQDSKDGILHDYIDAIIFRWDNEKNTYVAPRPVQTMRECFPLTPEDRLTIRTATNIAFDVQVDERGNATSVELQGDSKDVELARRMRESLMTQRFVPSNQEDGVRPGNITVVCRVEVR
jgi:hypothetical protein